VFIVAVWQEGAHDKFKEILIVAPVCAKTPEPALKTFVVSDSAEPFVFVVVWHAPGCLKTHATS
jgi:hypothetical protein